MSAPAGLHDIALGRRSRLAGRGADPLYVDETPGISAQAA
jgi:hypothetical protein